VSARDASYLSVDRSVRGWLLTHDHKRIGVMFLVANALALFVGGVFALLLRLELLTPGSDLVTPTTYNRLFTLHGVTMVWLFMIPAIPAGFGNFLLPIMVGARDVAFPRLNLASFWIYVLGALITVFGMFVGGADTGWTFYVPYSSSTATRLVPVLIGVFVLGISTIITGINFITTIHTMRDEQVGWSDVPLFAWALYGTSIIQVLATPVLGLTLLLVGCDHALDLGIFDAARGGDPLLYQHLFWFYSHPAVYIMVLPGMGVISEVVSTFSRKNPLSYRMLVVSTLGIALVGFLSWGHHMFTAGMSTFDAAAFGVLSMLVAVFSAIKVFTWVGTLYQGSITLATPFVYAGAFLFLFVFGGMTGVAVAATSLDVHWHDTYFVVAHFHFIMVGGTLTAYLAALHYWFPKISGRRYPERWGVAGAAMVFWGFLATFVPQFLLGNAGMPRRYATYPAEFQALHAVSTAGSWVLAAGLLLALVTLLVSLVRGERAGASPWGSASFEWRTPSPPPVENYVTRLDARRGPYDYGAPEAPETEPHAEGDRDASA
jgi:cytochrome c oxidase subunit 1